MNPTPSINRDNRTRPYWFNVVMGTSDGGGSVVVVVDPVVVDVVVPAVVDVVVPAVVDVVVDAGLILIVSESAVVSLPHVKTYDPGTKPIVAKVCPVHVDVPSTGVPETYPDGT